MLGQIEIITTYQIDCCKSEFDVKSLLEFNTGVGVAVDVEQNRDGGKERSEMINEFKFVKRSRLNGC